MAFPKCTRPFASSLALSSARNWAAWRRCRIYRACRIPHRNWWYQKSSTGDRFSEGLCRAEAPRYRLRTSPSCRGDNRRRTCYPWSCSPRKPLDRSRETLLAPEIKFHVCIILISFLTATLVLVIFVAQHSCVSFIWFHRLIVWTIFQMQSIMLYAKLDETQSSWYQSLMITVTFGIQRVDDVVITVFLVFLKFPLLSGKYTCWNSLTLTSWSTSVPKSSVTLDLPQPIMVHKWFVGKGCFGAGKHAIPLDADGVRVIGKRSRATSLSTVSASYSGWMVTESTYAIAGLIDRARDYLMISSNAYPKL